MPAAPIDFINLNATLFKTNIAWANGPSAADTKLQPGAGRTNISYASAELSLKSENVEAAANYIAEKIKETFGDIFANAARKAIKKTLGAINDKVKAGIGQNFGEANYLPLKPGALAGGNSAVLSVTHPDGTIDTVGLKSDGTGKVSIQVGDKLELLVLSDAGDPSYTDALGGSLSITNKTRYSGLPTRGNVWDYSNRGTIPANGFPGPFLPFTYQGKSGLATKPGLTVPGNPPNQPPGTDYFYLVGELTSVSKGLCDQVASKGEADWRFTAENVIFAASQTPPAPGLTSSSYLGGVKVTCGNNVDFFAGGNYSSPNLLVQDGQEVLVDCDNAFPIAINFKQGQTITEPRIKYDGVLTVPDPIVLPDNTTLIRSTPTATTQDKANGGGTHTITAEAKGVGGQLKTSKRTFMLKCKEKLMPSAGPLTLSIKDGDQTVELVNAETVLTRFFCPGTKTLAVYLEITASFRANNDPNSQQLSVIGLSIDARDDASPLASPFTQLGVVAFSGFSRPFTATLPFNAVRSFLVGKGVSLRGTGLAELTLPPLTKASATVVDKHITINYVGVPATDENCIESN